MWRILDIEPTRDIATIKAAYANKAKEWHPEEHPEEFQRLRTAYKQALQYAKSGTYTVTPREIEIAVNVNKETVKPSEPRVTELRPIVSKSNELQSTEQKPIEQQSKEQQPTESQPAQKGIKFDYGEVGAKEEQKRLLREFRWIALNPYLMNSVDCWEYYLGQEHWGELLQEQEVYDQLCELITALDGWKRSTLLFLKDKITETGRKVNTITWKKLEVEALFRGILGHPDIETPEDKIMNNALLEQLRKRRIPYDLKYREAIEAYLPLYISYAESAESELERRYNERKGKRNSKVVLRTLVITLTIAFLVYGYFEFEKDDNKTLEEITNTEMVEQMEEAIQFQMEASEGVESISADVEEVLDTVLKLWETRDKMEDEILLTNGFRFAVNQTKDEYGNSVTCLEVWGNKEEDIVIREKVIVFDLPDAKSYLESTWQGKIKLDPMILLNLTENGVHYYLEREEGGEQRNYVITEEKAGEWIKESILEQIKETVAQY